jgi:hypothetical protein
MFVFAFCRWALEEEKFLILGFQTLCQKGLLNLEGSGILRSRHKRDFACLLLLLLECQFATRARKPITTITTQDTRQHPSLWTFSRKPEAEVPCPQPEPARNLQGHGKMTQQRKELDNHGFML